VSDDSARANLIKVASLRKLLEGRPVFDVAEYRLYMREWHPEINLQEEDAMTFADMLRLVLCDWQAACGREHVSLDCPNCLLLLERVTDTEALVLDALGTCIANSDDPIHSDDIAVAAGMAPETARRHLAALTSKGLVECTRAGGYVPKIARSVITD
jgi:hypothetical protein